MAHSYEEIRSATCDLISGKESGSYSASRFDHLKISVGEVLDRRDNKAPKPPSTYPADTALDADDTETLMEVFWDLFRDGIITLGRDRANDNFPWFRVTGRGEAILKDNTTYFTHDVSGLERRVRSEVPDIDDVTLLYLKEAFQAFRSGCILSSTVMLGVASEHTFEKLIEELSRHTSFKTIYSTVQRETTILRRINKFRNITLQNKGGIPKELEEDFETQFLAIQSIIRNFRNESGHPSGKIIDREQAFVNLQLFIPFAKKVYQFITHASAIS